MMAIKGSDSDSLFREERLYLTFVHAARRGYYYGMALWIRPAKD
jgi:hypothetical protein